MSTLKIEKPLVSVDWLQNNLNNDNIVVLDCTIPKVTAKKSDGQEKEKLRIQGAVFFDIKKVFSDIDAKFPNTVLNPEDFQKKARDLSINNNSILICYDDLGIYSSPRVWWMFQLMGFKNVAVLDGGLPEWKSKNYPVEKPKENSLAKGDLTANYQPSKLKYTNDVLSAMEDTEIVIADARSKGRFNATAPEPREDIKGGHIPNSISLPFSEVLVDGKFKKKEELQKIFGEVNPKNKDFIFSCGSGITASILALGAEISGFTDYAVYDGSWTEWGTTEGLPIEK